MRTSRGSVAVAAVAGLVVSAGIVGWALRTPTEPSVVEAGRSPAALARDRAVLLRTIPEAQAAALRDRRVTVAEYEAAVTRSMRCLAHDLVAVRPDLAARPPVFTEPTWSEDHFTFAFEFRLPVDDLDPRPLDRSCQERYSRTVEAVFHIQRWADPAYLARSTAAFHRCLDAARLPGRSSDGARARFEAVLAAPSVDDQEAIEARKCIGARPSIGDLTP